MSKQTLADIGFRLLAKIEACGAATAQPDEEATKKARSLGMTCLLTVGEEHCSEFPSIAAIFEAASAVRRKGGLAAVPKEQMRVREMLLCGPEAKGSNLFYSLGQTQLFYFRWWAATPDQQQAWREDILKTGSESRSRGGRASAAERDMGALEMELCGPDEKGSSLLYSLGGADRYYYRWWVVDDDKRRLWREEILKLGKEERLAGAKAGAGASAGKNIAAATVTHKAKALAILDRLIVHVKSTKPDLEYEHWVEEVKAAKGARSTNTVHVSEAE